ncbi:unnamed protein product, partial [Rotaria sp. Silwood1]
MQLEKKTMKFLIQSYAILVSPSLGQP